MGLLEQRLHMDYIIFDLEWNQSSHPGEVDENGNTLPFEIVEIGAVKLNENRDMIGEFSELIKPQIYHEMHCITSKLIHLQMEQLEKGKPFTEVMEQFLEWCGEDCIFCTWGPLDLLELQRNMRYYGMEPLSDKPIRYYDIQKLFSIAYEDKKSRRSLEYAIDMLGIHKDIPFHRAFSDAYYTAQVFDMIEDPVVLEKVSFDTFMLPDSKANEVSIHFIDYDKHISRVFTDKSKLLNDKDIIDVKCFRCRRSLKKKVKWFSPNGKHYYTVAYCLRHGYTKSKLRVRKADGGGVYAVKTSKNISTEDAKQIKEKAKILKGGKE